MVLKFEKGFTNQALKLPESTQVKLKELIENIKTSTTMDTFNVRSILGFPYLFTIEIDNYFVGYQVINGEIVFIGVVLKDQILTIFF